MSGISKTIERVKDGKGKFISKSETGTFLAQLESDALEIITAYEQSQVQLGYEKDERSKAIMMFNYEINQLKADLDTANKRIFVFEGQKPRRKWLEEEVINRKKKIAEAKVNLDMANKHIAELPEKFFEINVVKYPWPKHKTPLERPYWWYVNLLPNNIKIRDTHGRVYTHHKMRESAQQEAQKYVDKKIKEMGRFVGANR